MKITAIRGAARSDKPGKYGSAQATAKGSLGGTRGHKA